MRLSRPESLVATCDQWVRASHEHTAVEGPRGDLVLSWHDPLAHPAPGGPVVPARGLATDRLCRIYRLRAQSVERYRTGSTAHGLDYGALPPPTTVIGGVAAPSTVGPDFTAPPPADLLDGRGIAIDEDDRLFVSDAGRRTIAVIDLWSRRLLRVVTVGTPRHPGRYAVGLAQRAGVVHAVVLEPAGLLRLTASQGPVEVELPVGTAQLAAGTLPARVAVLPDGEPVLLFLDGNGEGWLVTGHRSPLAVGPATDIVVDTDGNVVVAPAPAADGLASLRRWTPNADGWNAAHPLDATGYDGSGLVVTVEGRIGYFTAAGFRLAVVGAVAYETEGACVTYRFDSGVPANTWGRLFVEACVPDGTECLVGSVTSDDEFATPMPHQLAVPALCLAADDVVAPPLPPTSLVSEPLATSGGLHRRPDPVTPWWRADRRYDTFEAPVLAPPGRYLWVTLRLRGNRRRTPRVRELRVEHRGHTLLRRLPAVFAADPRQADFLHRYLACFDGLLQDLDLRAQCRDVLLDPSGTPAEALDWLASFVGLALDDRWAEAARRRLVADIVELYRYRGTMWALTRYVAIFLAGKRAMDAGRAWVQPIIVEHYRLRGVGGPLLDDAAVGSWRSVVGAGFRVGGAVGQPDDDTGAAGDATSSFASHAHRFTVLVPQPLDATQEAAVRHLLDTERPAHTAYAMCTVDAGMRVGRGLHLGLSSIVGPTGSFGVAVLDRTHVGGDVVLGGPTTGAAVEAARVGTTARVG